MVGFTLSTHVVDPVVPVVPVLVVVVHLLQVFGHCSAMMVAYTVELQRLAKRGQSEVPSAPILSWQPVVPVVPVVLELQHVWLVESQVYDVGHWFPMQGPTHPEVTVPELIELEVTVVA